MKNKRIIIYLLIFTALFSLLGTSVYYLNKLNAVVIYNNSVEHTYEVISNIDLLERSLIEAETGQRGFLLTNDSSFLQPYIFAVKRIPVLFLKLDYLTAGELIQQKRLDTLQEFINARLAYLQNNINVKDQSMLIKAIKTGQICMDKTKQIILHIDKHEQLLLKTRNGYKTKSTYDSKVSSFMALLIAFVFCCMACLVIIKFFNQNEKHVLTLLKTNYELAAQNADFEAMIIASTHNLQEPMRKVQVFIELYLDKNNNLDETTYKDFDRLHRIFKQQQTVNNSIIDYFSLVKNNAILLKLNVKNTIEKLIIQNNWQPHVSLIISNKLEILSDIKHLQILLENIVINSLLFNDKQFDLKITITQINQFVLPQHLMLSGIKEFIAICISDNGAGIDKAYHQKIFELFQKIENINIDQKGMGLSLCKRIMLHNNGWIEAQDNTPNGVNIILYFPKVK